jgi:hypothetical protein
MFCREGILDAGTLLLLLLLLLTALLASRAVSGCSRNQDASVADRPSAGSCALLLLLLLTSGRCCC